MLVFLVIGVLGLLLGVVATACGGGSRQDALSSPAAVDLRVDMRKLWEDHVIWTRMYIVSVAADLPDKDLTARRLLQNQEDIGNAIKPYYGNEAGAQLTALLKEHILGAARLLDAAKAGDAAKADSAIARWYDNGDDIAAFLSTTNPTYWPPAPMQAQMKVHLDLTLVEATDRLKGDYGGDIQAYDQVHAHILVLSDALTTGIVNQFPKQFK
ncbi:MAG: hypothetical protein HY683_08245 [Chloroflexi bacterium]|nr:hypothetical protein [Chloroflexota bacterium]